jgi:hypothetical protein
MIGHYAGFTRRSEFCGHVHRITSERMVVEPGEAEWRWDENNKRHKKTLRVLRNRKSSLVFCRYATLI